MKTRTLLLLAVACGTAILIAGAFLFVKLAGQDDPVEAVPVGVATTVGDMQVTVQLVRGGRRTRRRGGHASVASTTTTGSSGSNLVTAGGKAVPETSSADDPPACGALTVAEQRCTLSFPLPPNPGTTRILVSSAATSRCCGTS